MKEGTDNIAIVMSVPINESNEIVKMETYSARRTLLIFAGLDFIFQMLNGIIFLTDKDNSNNLVGIISFVCAFLILVGAYGINKYDNCITEFYRFFLIFHIISIFISLFFTRNLVYYIFSIFIIILNIWILKILRKFTKNLETLNTSDLDDLKSGWVPSTVVFYY